MEILEKIFRSGKGKREFVSNEKIWLIVSNDKLAFNSNSDELKNLKRVSKKQSQIFSF